MTPAPQPPPVEGPAGELDVTATSTDDVLLVDVRGDLTTRTGPELRLALLRAAGEQPRAIVCRLHLRSAARAALTALLSTASQLSAWPSIRFVVCSTSTELLALTRSLGAADRVPVVATLEEALEMVQDLPAQDRDRICLEPRLPVAGRAREFVSSACRRWQVPQDVADSAELVVDELVVNAVVHAGTPLEVSLAHSESELRVAVADQASTPLMIDTARAEAEAATAESGRGLMLVEALCQRWGVLPGRAGGKVVWAQLG